METRAATPYEIAMQLAGRKLFVALQQIWAYAEQVRRDAGDGRPERQPTQANLKAIADMAQAALLGK